MFHDIIRIVASSPNSNNGRHNSKKIFFMIIPLILFEWKNFIIT